MPNMDELINQISSELSKNESDPIWIPVIDLDYAYGQMRLAPETSKHCNFAITGEKINGYYRFLKGFYGPADIPTIFQEKKPNARPPNTRVVGRHSYRNTQYKRATHTKTGISLNETRKRRIQSQQKEIKILPKRNNMVGTYHITRRNQTEQRKNGRHQRIGTTNKHQNTQIISRCDTMFGKIHTKSIQKKPTKCGNY